MTNIPSPYRVDFFTELSKLCDLTVLFERRLARNRASNWIKPVPTYVKHYFLHGIPVGDDTVMSLDAIRYISNQKFDRIIVGGYSTPTSMMTIEYLSCKKIPFYLNADGGFVKTESEFKHSVKAHFIGKASAWLSTGQVTDKYLKHYGANAERIFRYGFASLHEREISARPLSEQEKKEIRKELNVFEEKVVLTVGRFVPEKGIDILLESARQFDSDVGVYIVGGEPTTEYLNLIAQNNLNNVHFVGFISKDELKRYYFAADLFVFPTRSDVWGLVVNEAMSTGLPVITTSNCGAGLEMIRDGEQGYIIDVDDAKALAEKVNLILGDDDSRTTMSQNCIRKCKHYTIENMAKEHFSILSSSEKISEGKTKNNVEKSHN